MRRRLPLHAALLALVVLAAPFLAPTAAAQDRTLHVRITDEGFRVEGYSGLNPVVPVAPGEDVLFRVENLAARAHDLALGAPVDRATPCCLEPTRTATLRVTIPAAFEGDVSYFSSQAPSTHRGVLRAGADDPVIRLLSPADGADAGADVEVRVEVERFALEPYVAGREPEAGRGHVRYLLDGRVVDGPTDRTSLALPNLTEGFHLVRAELVGLDGQPLSPPAHAEAVVYRSRDPPPSEPTADAGGGTPLDDARAPGPGLALVAAALAVAAARRARR